MILHVIYLIPHVSLAFRRPLYLNPLPLIIDLLLLFQTCLTITHYSTYLNDNLEAPVFKKGAAFLFKYQAVTSESESKVRVFSPFPKIPEVNLTGAEHMLATAIARTIALGSTYATRNGNGCAIEKINETYDLLTQQLENRINMVKQEMSASVKDQNGLSEITKSFLPQIHRTEEASIKRHRRFIGAVAAIGAGAGLILGDPIKDAACTALSIFNMCDDNSQLSRDIEAAMDTQQQTILTLQRVQAKNDDNFFLLGNEVKETQNNVKQIRDQVNEHLQTLDARMRTIKIELLAYKECRRVEMVHLRFLQEIRNFISDLGTLYTHIKSYQAAFYAYKINLFSTISSLASGKITPQFLVPNAIADIVNELSNDEIRRGTKLSPAIQPGYEAIYYEINVVLEVTLLPRGISVVLGIPMNSKSSTFDAYHAIPLYQPNGDNKTASLYQLQKPFLAVSTDNSRFAELDSSTLQQCSGNNRIKLCRKGFSTTTDETLLCLSSLLYNYDIPSLRNCPVHSVLLPDAPQAFYLADGMYHIISRDPILQVKNDSRTHGISVTKVMCQACLMRPSCTSTLSFNQGDLVLSPDMDFCESNPEPFVATVALTPSLEHVFKHVPQTSNVFNVYSLGEARQSIIDSVQMELAELPDVHRMSPTAIDELTRPIAEYYSSIPPATSQALQSYLPYRTAVLFSGFSITLSLLTFTISFTLFRRHWKRLFLHPQRFFASSQGRFIQIMDGTEDSPQIEDNSPFLYLTKHEFLALQGLAKETLQLHSPSNYTADPISPNVPPRAYPDISAPHYSETTT